MSILEEKFFNSVISLSNKLKERNERLEIVKCVLPTILEKKYNNGLSIYDNDGAIDECIRIADLVLEKIKE